MLCVCANGAGASACVHYSTRGLKRMTIITEHRHPRTAYTVCYVYTYAYILLLYYYQSPRFRRETSKTKPWPEYARAQTFGRRRVEHTTTGDANDAKYIYILLSYIVLGR